MIEVVLDDRLGKKVRVKCNEDDTIGDLKKLAAAQVGGTYGTMWIRMRTNDCISHYGSIYFLRDSQ